MMKSVFVSLAVLFLSAMFVSANVYVNWRASAGFYFNADPSTGILGVGQSALAQLIWRPNNTGARAGTDAADVNDANLVSGDDIWLADFVVNEADRPAGEWAYFTDAPTFDDGGARAAGGYFYARIFETLNPVAGDWYYVGNVVLASDLNPGGATPDPPQLYNMNRDTTDGDAIDGAFGFEVVPEPGTIGLLALGIATLGGAAHKRRKAAVVVEA